mmetsp:Transcript_18028/g.50063  ORF Transcript_18028/g.50063 Transcript_18028/m.50063 type:complete len:340 (-) Transcript_18028:522-1541(-)
MVQDKAKVFSPRRFDVRHDESLSELVGQFQVRRRHRVCVHLAHEIGKDGVHLGQKPDPLDGNSVHVLGGGNVGRPRGIVVPGVLFGNVQCWRSRWDHLVETAVQRGQPGIPESVLLGKGMSVRHHMCIVIIVIQSCIIAIMIAIAIAITRNRPSPRVVFWSKHRRNGPQQHHIGIRQNDNSVVILMSMITSMITSSITSSITSILMSSITSIQPQPQPRPKTQRFFHPMQQSIGFVPVLLIPALAVVKGRRDVQLERLQARNGQGLDALGMDALQIGALGVGAARDEARDGSGLSDLSGKVEKGEGLPVLEGGAAGGKDYVVFLVFLVCWIWIWICVCV